MGRSWFTGQRAWPPQEEARSTPARGVQSQSISHTGGSGPSLELSSACLFMFTYSGSCHWHLPGANPMQGLCQCLKRTLLGFADSLKGQTANK